MKAIPRTKEVAQALRASELAVKEALKELNHAAGTLMAKGDYSGAEALAAKGREMQEFCARVQGLKREWKALRSGGSRKSDSSHGPSTPLWGYYQPILKALVAGGGSARRAELEPDVLKLMADCFQAADEETMARGQTRWQVMIRRARKHLVGEGWIEDRAGPWTITPAGRRVAERPAFNAATHK